MARRNLRYPLKSSGARSRPRPGSTIQRLHPKAPTILSSAWRVRESKPIMKAIQVRQVGGPEAMELVELPVPQPKANEAVVKLAASGVNFIDVYHREGRYKVPLPFTPGQEGAGVVTAVGAEVTSVKVGDRVAWSALLGSYAEYAVLPADKLVSIPSGVTEQQAAAAM